MKDINNTEHDAGYYAILEAKYARIIEAISEMHAISLDKAMDIFYNSDIMKLLEEGIADLHCRSDKYLAEEIWNERNETQSICYHTTTRT